MVAAAAMKSLQSVLKHQFPLPDDGHMVGHLVDLAQKVAGHHHRHAEPARQFTDQLPHLLDACRVQAIGGLVQNQQFGIAQQSCRQAQPLLHTQGVVGHLLAALAIQPDDLQHLPDISLWHAPESLDDPQVFLPGEMAVVTGTFDEASHLPENREAVAAVHLLSQYLDVSRRGAN